MKDNNQKKHNQTERVLAYTTTSVIDLEQLKKISGGSGTQQESWRPGYPPVHDVTTD